MHPINNILMETTLVIAKAIALAMPLNGQHGDTNTPSHQCTSTLLFLGSTSISYFARPDLGALTKLSSAWSHRDPWCDAARERGSSPRSTRSILMKGRSVLQMWKPNKLNEFLKVAGGVDSNCKQNPADWHLNDRLTVNLHFDSPKAAGRQSEVSKSDRYILNLLCASRNRDSSMWQQLIQFLKSSLLHGSPDISLSECLCALHKSYMRALLSQFRGAVSAESSLGPHIRCSITSVWEEKTRLGQ